MWLRKAWVWLKENWKSVLLGVFTLGVGLLVGRAARRKQEVVAPELLGSEEVRKKADEEASKKLEEARKKRRQEAEKIEKEHAETVARLTREQRDKLEELREDPDELNSFLLQVGGDVRDTR